jgi:hypothetical protein
MAFLASALVVIVFAGICWHFVEVWQVNHRPHMWSRVEKSWIDENFQGGVRHATTMAAIGFTITQNGAPRYCEVAVPIAFRRLPLRVGELVDVVPIDDECGILVVRDVVGSG